MKLCPQCEFIYEDDQSICDMDGKELVNDSGTLTVGTPSQQHSAPALSELVSPRRQWRSFALAAVIGVVLIALLLTAYYARVKAHPVNVPPVANQSPGPATSAEIGVEVPPADVVAASQLAEEMSSPLPIPVTAFPADVSESASRKVLGAGPVTARSSAVNSRSSAVIWLRNGSSIRADEVWEKLEGVWYRQAGLVTFLKHSQIRKIQRPGPQQYSKAEPTKRVTTPTQKRPVANADPANARKDSRVGSFLKKTGRILSKPFKL